MVYKYHYTYKITNINNYMMYIGVRSCNCWPTKDVDYWGSSKPLHNAILKEGKHWFKKDILAIWDTRKLASDHEIKLHNFFEVGVNKMFYNKCKSRGFGFDTTGTKHSTDTKLKMSKNHANVKNDKNPMYGKHRSQKTKQLISIANKNKTVSINTKLKMSKNHANVKNDKNPMYGKKHTNESKLKMKGPRENFKGDNNSKGMLGKKHTDEAKLKISEKSKGRKHTDEAKLKISKANKNKPKSAEQRLKISESLKIKNKNIKKMWINKNNTKKLIDVCNLDHYVTNNWKIGMKG